VTPESPVIAELRMLLDALCEETITTEQTQRLEELVLTNPEAEAFYVQYMSFQADLIRQFSTDLPTPAPVNPEAPVAVSLANETSEPALAPLKRPRRRARFLLWGAIGLSGLAAGLLLGLTVRGPAEPGLVSAAPAEPTDDTVAVLLQTNRAVWEETGLPTRPGAPLPAGRLVLKSGHAHIEFYSGVTVILEGPAEFQLLSRNAAYCAHGKLRARVPPHAQGFSIGAPNLNLVDRGTEFGLDVGGARTEVHVFEGKVDLYDPGADADAPPRKELTTGQGMSLERQGGANSVVAAPAEFLTASQLAQRTAADTARRRTEWVEASETLRRDPTLVAYFPFEIDPTWDRRLRDEANGRQAPNDGAIVGCSWGTGRWARKRALEFKRVSDRVRLHVPGEFRSLTLAAWVRPDALPNVNHSLLMADGWEEGEPHWQIGADGTLILGVRGPPDYNPEPNVRGPQYRAHGAITPERFGRWTHLAVVYDGDRKEVVHYMDGQPVARSEFLLDQVLRIGDAEIGNWTAGSFRSKSLIRNFNGAVDEFMLFSRALSDAEIEKAYAQGRPPR
jgi:hypothetical protein